jgi:predicted HTH transcriptional regulator
MISILVKKAMEWMKEWEGGSKEQGLVSDVMKFIQQQAASAPAVPAKAIATDRKPAAKPTTKPAPKLPALNLNKRQEQIYNMIRDRGEVNMQALTKKFSQVSSRTLRRDMTQLEELGLISQSGKTKNSIYKIVSSK